MRYYRGKKYIIAENERGVSAGTVAILLNTRKDVYGRVIVQIDDKIVPFPVRRKVTKTNLIPTDVPFKILWRPV